MLIKVVEEMVKNAAQGIGVEYHQRQVDYVMAVILYHKGVNINEDIIITHELMAAIVEVIEKWQRVERKSS